MFSKRWLTKERILAVHDYDFDDFFSSIGLLEHIHSGRRNCSVCGTPISVDNLAAVYSEDNILALICDNYSCLATALDNQASVRE